MHSSFRAALPLLLAAIVLIPVPPAAALAADGGPILYVDGKIGYDGP